MNNSRPNVLIVVLDSARPAWLSCYDGAITTTPHIDSIAHDGYLFETAISPSAWTFPAMASVFTGMLPTKHGGHDEHVVLDSEYPTMAELFARNGYDTAAISDLPYIGPRTKLDRGFRTMSNLRQSEVSVCNMFLKGVGRGHRMITRAYQKTNESRVVIGESLRWLKKRRDRSKPFLLYIHTDEPHAPMLPPARFRRRLAGMSARRMRSINQDKELFMAGAVEMSQEDLDGLRDLARAETAFFDEWFGRLTNYLERNRMLDDTIIVVTADHGENFGEHGLLRHGHCLYDTLLRVPLIIRPAGGRDGIRVKSMVQLIDLLPTLLAMASIDEPAAEAAFQGGDLLRAIGTGQFPEYAVSELYRPASRLVEEKVPEFMPEWRAKYDRVLRSYRTPTHKLIWSSNGRHELYDLGNDPGEEHDLITSERDLAAELQTKLDAWLESFPHCQFNEHSPAPEFDDARLAARLRELGYLE